MAGNKKQHYQCKWGFQVGSFKAEPDHMTEGYWRIRAARFPRASQKPRELLPESSTQAQRVRALTLQVSIRGIFPQFLWAITHISSHIRRLTKVEKMLSECQGRAWAPHSSLVPRVLSHTKPPLGWSFHNREAGVRTPKVPGYLQRKVGCQLFSSGASPALTFLQFYWDRIDIRHHVEFTSQWSDYRHLNQVTPVKFE